jgi:hypothetical protein
MDAKVAKALFHSHSYHEYRKLLADLLLDNKSTGEEQSAELLDYSRLNDTRMNRLDKTIVISDDISLKLKSLKKEYIWIVITEGWCGDSAQIIPVLDKMTHASHKIDLKLVLRSENEDLMNLVLTNGAKSIPKVIIIDKKTSEVLSTWGPRPEGAVDLIEKYKEKFGKLDEIIKADLQLWYFKDKGIEIQNELTNLMIELDQLNYQPSLYF